MHIMSCLGVSEDTEMQELELPGLPKGYDPREEVPQDSGVVSEMSLSDSEDSSKHSTGSADSGDFKSDLSGDSVTSNEGGHLGDHSKLTAEQFMSLGSDASTLTRDDGPCHKSQVG